MLFSYLVSGKKTQESEGESTPTKGLFKGSANPAKVDGQLQKVKVKYDNFQLFLGSPLSVLLPKGTLVNRQILFFRDIVWECYRN